MSVLFIIPCYNEFSRINPADYKSYITSNSHRDSISFLFVNDGSTDDTISILNQLADTGPAFKVLDLKKNGGKAEAIRQGVLSVQEGQYDYIGYLDADLATPLEELPRLMEYTAKTPAPYFIMGSRIKLLGFSKIDRKLSRHYIGRIFATVVSNMLQLSVYDTQCGAKLIKSEIAKELFKKPFLSKWLFDVELLFRLKKLRQDYKSRIYEVPLRRWQDVAGSKIKLSYYFKAPLDLLRINFKYR